jgi:hypothetical protein
VALLVFRSVDTPTVSWAAAYTVSPHQPAAHCNVTAPAACSSVQGETRSSSPNAQVVPVGLTENWLMAKCDVWPWR